MEVYKEGTRVEEACYEFERRSLITLGKMDENDVVVQHPSTSRYGPFSTPVGPCDQAWPYFGILSFPRAVEGWLCGKVPSMLEATPVFHPCGRVCDWHSRYHALLVVSKLYGPLLVDLEAPNGTFIDGRRLEPLKGAKLNDGAVRPQNPDRFPF